MSGVEVVPAPSSGLVEFSYGDLTDEAAGIARSAATGVKSAQEHALREVGRHLLRAREALPHGAFTPWLQAELGITDRTARNYMQAAAFLDGKPETIAVLPPTVLYALSARTAPSEIVQAGAWCISDSKWLLTVVGFVVSGGVVHVLDGASRHPCGWRALGVRGLP